MFKKLLPFTVALLLIVNTAFAASEIRICLSALTAHSFAASWRTAPWRVGPPIFNIYNHEAVHTLTSHPELSTLAALWRKYSGKTQNQADATLLYQSIVNLADYVGKMSPSTKQLKDNAALQFLNTMLPLMVLSPKRVLTEGQRQALQEFNSYFDKEEGFSIYSDAYDRLYETWPANSVPTKDELLALTATELNKTMDKFAPLKAELANEEPIEIVAAPELSKDLKAILENNTDPDRIIRVIVEFKDLKAYSFFLQKALGLDAVIRKAAVKKQGQFVKFEASVHTVQVLLRTGALTDEQTIATLIPGKE